MLISIIKIGSYQYQCDINYQNILLSISISISILPFLLINISLSMHWAALLHTVNKILHTSQLYKDHFCQDSITSAFLDTKARSPAEVFCIGAIFLKFMVPLYQKSPCYDIFLEECSKSGELNVWSFYFTSKSLATLIERAEYLYFYNCFNFMPKHHIKQAP